MKVEKPRIAWIGSLSSLPDDDDGKCFSRARRPESSELGNRFLSCRRGLTFSHNQDPKRLGGTPVFAGTRVPVQTFFEYMEGGETLDEFLEHFPDVSREHAEAVRRQSNGSGNLF